MRVGCGWCVERSKHGRSNGGREVLSSDHDRQRGVEQWQC